MSGLQNLIFKNEFFKSPNSLKSGNFRSIGFGLLKFKIYENICNDHQSSVLCSLVWCVLCWHWLPWAVILWEQWQSPQKILNSSRLKSNTCSAAGTLPCVRAVMKFPLP